MAQKTTAKAPAAAASAAAATPPAAAPAAPAAPKTVDTFKFVKQVAEGMGEAVEADLAPRDRLADTVRLSCEARRCVARLGHARPQP